ncbi:MAG: hypothetical protein OEW11_10075 [Nitrospirota bacterium]|nr:hypothetical protein [Nitrospirota bacterium]
MSQATIARVRVYYGGKRYVGEVTLPSAELRVSDVLNDRRPFLCLTNARSADDPGAGGPVVLRKGRISFIQVMEETPRAGDRRIQGNFVAVEIALEQTDVALRGKLFLPEGVTTLDSVLNDERDFLSVSEVTIPGGEDYPFLAVAKGQVLTIRLQPPAA